MQKRVIGFWVFLSVFVISNLLFFEIPTNIQRTYNLTTITEDGVEIKYDLYEPSDISKINPKKAVILGHGLMVNKEVMRFFAIELAYEGFVVLAFDFRSHGKSGGDFNQAAQSTADTLLDDKEKTNNTGTLGGTFDTSFIKYDLRAIKQVLMDRDDIDIHHLGYLGFSMGGEAGFEVIPEDSDFQAMVGLAPSFNYDLVTPTMPPNLLLLIGQFDEAISLNKLYKVMEYRTGLDRSQIQPGKLYGSFADGTASKIYYDPYAEHFLGSYNPNFIRETRNWFVAALQGRTIPEQTIISSSIGLFFLIQMLGAIGLFTICAEWLITKFSKMNEIPELYTPSKDQKLSIGVFPYVIFFSHILMLFIWEIFAVPLLFSDFIVMILFGPSYAIYLYIRVLYKRYGVNRTNLKVLQKKRINHQNLIIGGILGGLILLLMKYSIGNIFGIIPNYWKLLWVPIFFLCLCWIFRNYIWFQTMILERDFKNNSSKYVIWKSNIKAFFLFGGIITFLLLVPCIAFKNYFVAMLLIPLSLVFGATSFVTVYCYTKNKDIWIPIIALSLFTAIFISTLSPIMNLWVLNY